MAFLDDFGELLFGKAPDSKVTQESVLSDDQGRLLDMLVNSLRLGNRPSPAAVRDIPQFGEQRNAPMSDLQQMSLAGLENIAGGLAEGGNPLQGQAESTLSELLKGGPGDFEEFFSSAVERPAIETFREDIVPTIRARNAANFFSTGRQNVEAKATEDLTEGLTGARSQLAFQTREAAKNRQLSALGLVDTVTGLPIRQAISLLQAGDVPREIEQAGMDREYQEFLRQQDERSRRINEILASIGLPTLENIATVSGGSAGVVPSFLAGGGLQFEF